VQIVADGVQDTFIVRVTTDEDIVGIGEATSAPTVLKAIVDLQGSQVAARGLRELLVGEDLTDIDRLWGRMYDYTSVYGLRGVTIHAISAIDIALWDVMGQATGKPVSTLLGGRHRERVRVYASALFPERRDEARAMVDGLVQSGFTAVKLGWGPLGRDVADDVKVVAEIRRDVGPAIDLMVDIGLPLPFEAALELSCGLRELGVLFLEEPLSPDDLDGYAVLARDGGVAIAGGEKYTSVSEFERFARTISPGYLQPDVARVGGLSQARRVADLAASRGCTVVPHCWASDVLGAASLHLVSSMPDGPLLEYCVSDHSVRRNLVREPLTVRDGFLDVPEAPGLGVELDDTAIQQLRIA
jgi:L-alanine-DL-glutamate epimerase-like enolase superfamily enzyme